jgi:hypothetical protein
MAAPRSTKSAYSAAALCTRDHMSTESAASAEPAVMITRGSARSRAHPTQMPASADVPSAIVAASETSDEVSPRSSRIGANSTGKAYSRTP